jgi:serine/threonine protein kinase
MIVNRCFVVSEYRAPEVFLKCHNISFPIDIWSAACAIFEVATKQVLFLARKDAPEKKVSVRLQLWPINDSNDPHL